MCSEWSSKFIKTQVVGEGKTWWVSSFRFEKFDDSHASDNYAMLHVVRLVNFVSLMNLGI